jgi:hypothetical protein
MALSEKDVDDIRSGRVGHLLERDARTVDWVEQERANQPAPSIDLDIVLTLASTPMTDPDFDAAFELADLSTLQAVLREQNVLLMNRHKIERRIEELQGAVTNDIVATAKRIETARAEDRGGPLVSAGGETVSVLVRKRSIITELQALVKHATQTHFEIGRRLHELQALSERGEFLKALQSDLWGFSPAAAYQHITFYTKCQALPSLRDLAENNYTKAIALFHGLEGEQLESFAKGELPQLAPEEFDAMSVRDLKKELKKLKKDVGTIVKEETKGLIQERDGLIKERDDALARLESPDWKRTKEQATELAKLAEKLNAQAAMLIDTMPKDQPVPIEILFGLETALFRAQTAAQTAWSRFEALKGEEE